MMDKIEVNNLIKRPSFDYDAFEYECEGFKIKSFVFKRSQEVGMHKVTTFLRKDKLVRVHEMYISKALYEQGDENLLISHIVEDAIRMYTR